MRFYMYMDQSTPEILYKRDKGIISMGGGYFIARES